MLFWYNQDMKKITCFDCEQSFEAESRDSILNQFYKHYMSEHNEIITGVDDAGKKMWMERFDKDWLKAKEV